jgi:hypothetical protein
VFEVRELKRIFEPHKQEVDVPEKQKETAQ